jgi:hypothetical protein
MIWKKRIFYQHHQKEEIKIYLKKNIPTAKYQISLENIKLKTKKLVHRGDIHIDSSVGHFELCVTKIVI